MKRFFTKKKESGAEGRKRRKLRAEEAKKSSKVFRTFFEKPRTRSSTFSMVSLGPATNLLESEGESSTSALQTEDVVRPDKSEYNEIESQAAKENVDMTGGEIDGGGDAEFIDEILPDEIEPEDTEPTELDDVEELRTVIPKVTEQHDIGLLKFDKDTGKAILPNVLKIEIIKLGLRYFQNNEEPFIPTNKRSMNKTWFKRKLGNGRGVEVTRP